jgi:hypothetical protein
MAGAQLQVTKQPGSGLLRTIVMPEQKDPGHACILAVFVGVRAEGSDETQGHQQGSAHDPRRGQNSRLAELSAVERPEWQQR